MPLDEAIEAHPVGRRSSSTTRPAGPRAGADPEESFPRFQGLIRSEYEQLVERVRADPDGRDADPGPPAAADARDRASTPQRRRQVVDRRGA